jgi:hypothetical protein
MAGNDPEAVVLAAEGVQTVPLAHVPHPAATTKIYFNKDSSPRALSSYQLLITLLLSGETEA